LAGTAITGAATAPGMVGVGLAAGAVAAEAAAWAGPRLQVRKRMGLSVRERRTAAVGMAGAAGWVGVVDVTAMPVLLNAGLLAAALGVPASRWWTSRAKPAPKLSAAAAAVVEKWGTNVAGPTGPKSLRGSRVFTASVEEPVDGAVAMIVQLDGVHAANATSTQLRRDVEVAMGLPADTVQLSALRDDGPADRLQVTMTPVRHLEAAPTAWPGPVLAPDGALRVALDHAAKAIDVHLWNKDGVEHGLISGTTGMGKGGTTVVMTVPGPLAGLEVVLYADGKRGMSAPELEPVVDKMGVTPEQWGALVDITHAIMVARETRYGAARLKRFEVGISPDPIVTLLLDEATTLNTALSSRRRIKVAEIAQRGRACGVRLVQVSQSVRGDMVVGGVPTRDLMTGGGFTIAHKPGGSSASHLATDGIAVAGLVDALKALPAQAGMAVIARRNEVLATQARVFDAEDDAIAAIKEWQAAGGVLRRLVGADLAAAGPAYANWDTTHSDSDGDEPATGGPDGSGGSGGSGSGDAGKGDTVGDWVVDALDPAVKGGRPRSAAELLELDGAPARATLYRALNRLLGNARIVNRGGTFHLALDPDTEAEVAADRADRADGADGADQGDDSDFEDAR
jgi:hypothetical protein